MAEIWAARLSDTPGLPGLVAIKTILPSHEDGQLESMLFDEASLAAAIRHPNVARILDLGEEKGTIYLVMEWIQGESLDYVMRAAHSTGGFPLPLAVNLIAQGLRGLEAAHQATGPNGEPLSIVHRDVSPQNLLITYGGVTKLIDFGVAKATQRMTHTTTTGQVKGKFAYMAPEQLHGKPLDARADIFAMGVVLYTATTGVHPFKSENPAATIHNVLSLEPTRPTELIPTYPQELEDVVFKALAKEKTERFASAEEMRLALERAVPAAADAGQTASSFLRQLFEKRIAERAEAIRIAVQAADSGVKASLSKVRGLLVPRSQSTMRAVSVDDEVDPIAEPEIVVEEEPARPASRRRAMAVRVLAGAAVVAALGVARWRTTGHPGAASLGSPSPVEPATSLPLPAPSALPYANVRNEIAASGPSVEYAPSPLPATSASAAATSHAPLKRRTARPASTGEIVVAPPAPTPAPISAPAPAAEVDPLLRRK